jgi:hypothetical protein
MEIAIRAISMPVLPVMFRAPPSEALANSLLAFVS